MLYLFIYDEILDWDFYQVWCFTFCAFLFSNCSLFILVRSKVQDDEVWPGFLAKSRLRLSMLNKEYLFPSPGKKEKQKEAVLINFCCSRCCSVLLWSAEKLIYEYGFQKKLKLFPSPERKEKKKAILKNWYLRYCSILLWWYQLWNLLKLLFNHLGKKTWIWKWVPKEIPKFQSELALLWTF